MADVRVLVSESGGTDLDGPRESTTTDAIIAAGVKNAAGDVTFTDSVGSTTLNALRSAGVSGLTANRPVNSSGAGTLTTGATETLDTLLSLNYFWTGITSRTDNTISFNDSSKIFTIAPTGASFTVYISGVKYSKTTETIDLSQIAGWDTDVLMFVYYNSSGVLSAANTAWTIDSPAAPIATVFWNGTTHVLGEERHGAKRHLALHEYLHKNFGTRYTSGLTGSFATGSMSIATGALADEDIPITISSTQTTGRIWYTKNSTSSFDGTTTQAAVISGGILQYNPAGVLSNVTTGYYVRNYVYGSNDVLYPIAIIPGNSQYSNINDARNDAFPSSPSYITSEIKLLYTVIYQNVGGTPTYIEATDFRTAPTQPNGRLAIRPIFLNEIEDVDAPTPSLGQVMTWNGLQWTNGAPATSSASAGIEWFNASPTITATGTQNSTAINTLSKVPVTTTEQTATINPNNSTVIGSAWLYDTALGRTTIDAGTWTFNQYAYVNNTGGGRVTYVRRGLYSVLDQDGDSTARISTTSAGGGTTSTVTIHTGSGLFDTTKITPSATNTIASYLQTPKGIYQITARSDTQLTVTVPTGYTAETGVVYKIWKQLFIADSPAITATSLATVQLVSYTSAQGAFTITAAHKLGAITFGVSNQNTTITTLYDGTARNTHFDSPLITLHNNLAGLQGGSANQYYHLTQTEATEATRTASGSQNGLLSSTDWTTFNNKQAALGFTPANNSPVTTSFDNLLSSTEDTVQKVFDRLDDHQHSTGSLSDITVTVNIANNGSVDISSVDAYLYPTSNWTGQLKKYTIAAATAVATTVDVTNYIVINYNSGTPIYQVLTSSATINNSNIVLVGKGHRHAVGEFHYEPISLGLATATRMANKDISLNRYTWQSGLTLTESATRVVNISSGVVWYGPNHPTIAQVSSSTVGTTKLWVLVGSNWTHSDVTQYNNTQFNDLADNVDGLTNLGNNEYGIVWVYRCISQVGSINLVLGNASYKSIAAASEALVSVPPPLVSSGSLLVGRIVIQQGASSGSITSAFASVFNQAPINQHNNLAGLNDGDYQHLTSAQLSTIPKIPAYIEDIITDKVITSNNSGTYSIAKGSTGVYPLVITGLTGGNTGGNQRYNPTTDINGKVSFIGISTPAWTVAYSGTQWQVLNTGSPVSVADASNDTYPWSATGWTNSAVIAEATYLQVTIPDPAPGNSGTILNFLIEDNIATKVRFVTASSGYNFSAKYSELYVGPSSTLALQSDGGRGWAIISADEDVGAGSDGVSFYRDLAGGSQWFKADGNHNWGWDFSLRKSRNSGAVLSGDTAGFWGAYVHDGGSYVLDAYIEPIATENHANGTNRGLALDLWSTQKGTTTRARSLRLAGKQVHQYVDSSAPSDGDIGASTLVPWVNETTNRVQFKWKTSGNSVKTQDVAVQTLNLFSEITERIKTTTYYKLMVYTNSVLTSIEYWDSESKNTKYYTVVFNYTNSILTSKVATRHSDNVSTTATFTYTNDVLTSTTYS